MLPRYYSTASSGIKIASKEAEGHLSKLVVKINAGSRFDTKDGLAHALSRFHFQNTKSKSALRFAREAELLGGFYSSTVTKDAIILSATFQKADLPFFVESFGNILAESEFKSHEFKEVVLPAIEYDASVASKNAEFQASELLHSIVFKNGLSKPTFYDGVSKLTLDDIVEHASKAYTKANIEVYGAGINEADLTKFIGESSFSKLAAGEKLQDSVILNNATQLRVRSTVGNVAGVATAIKPADYGVYSVVSTYLSSLGLKSSVSKYSDVGLFSALTSGPSAGSELKSALASLKSVKLNDYLSLAQVESAVLEESSLVEPEVSISQVGSFTAPKFSYVALGNTSALPYAEDL